MQLLQRAMRDGGAAEGPPCPPPAQGPCRATPRDVNQLVQHANLLEGAHEAAAGCESTDPPPPQQGCSPKARPHPDVPDAWAALGKVLRQQNGRAGPALLLLPPPPARPCGNAALPCQGSELLPRSIAPGSSQPHRLIPEGKASFPSAARPLSPNASLPLRTGALLQPGGAGMEGMQGIRQGPVYFGWLTSLLSYCSQKLWEGD